MSQEVTLSRRATLIRKSGILSPENPNDQIITFPLYSGTTTNATQTQLYLNGVSGSQLKLDSNTSCAFFLRILGQRVGGTQVYHSTIEGTIKRIVAVGTTAFVGDPLVSVISGDSLTWSTTIAADTTNGALELLVTGAGGITIHWIADISFVKVA